MNEVYFLFDFFRSLFRYKKLLALSIIFLALDVISELSVPIILKKLIDLPEIALVSAILISVVVINSVSRYLSIYFTNKTSQNILYNIRTELFSHMVKLNMKFFDKNQSGKLVIRLTNDVENLNELFVSGLVTFVADILIIIGVIVIIFYLNFKLALVSCAVFPAMVYVIIFFRKKASEIYLSIRKKIAELNSFTAESIMGIKTVKIIPAYYFSYERFRELNEDYSNEVSRAIKLFSFFFSSIIFFSSLSLTSVFLYGGFGIMKEEITFGTFIAFWYAINKLYDPVWDFSEKYNIFQIAVAAAKRIKEIMNEKEEPYGVGERNNIEGKIEFQDVYFSYDGKKEVLKGASFVIEPGEKVSIVGVTGAGKTTIANLMTRMYEPQRGKILIDGKDIKTYPIEFVRKNICFVHQDIFIMSGTVLDNITFGRYDKNKVKKIEEILEEARIKIPLSKYISEDGVGISTGEKQIISILRAIYYDPKVIILDEATAFLDIETEHKISSIIEKITGEKTIIKIAHRISTALNSEKIIVVKEGKTYTFPKLKREELIKML